MDEHEQAAAEAEAERVAQIRERALRREAHYAAGRRDHDLPLIEKELGAVVARGGADASKGPRAKRAKAAAKDAGES